MSSTRQGMAARRLAYRPDAERLSWPAATLAIGALSLMSWLAVGMVARLLFG